MSSSQKKDASQLLGQTRGGGKLAADQLIQRFFGGVTAGEVADHLGLSKSTVDHEWRLARAWLRNVLSEGADS